MRMIKGCDVVLQGLVVGWLAFNISVACSDHHVLTGNRKSLHCHSQALTPFSSIAPKDKLQRSPFTTPANPRSPPLPITPTPSPTPSFPSVKPTFDPLSFKASPHHLPVPFPPICSKASAPSANPPFSCSKPILASCSTKSPSAPPVLHIPPTTSGEEAQKKSDPCRVSLLSNPSPDSPLGGDTFSGPNSVPLSSDPPVFVNPSIGYPKRNVFDFLFHIH